MVHFVALVECVPVILVILDQTVAVVHLATTRMLRTIDVNVCMMILVL